MYYKKKIIISDRVGKVCGLVTLSGREELKVSVHNCAVECDGVILSDGKRIERFPKPPFEGVFHGYDGADLECVFVWKDRILATGCTSGKKDCTRLINAVLSILNKNQEKPQPTPPPREIEEEQHEVEEEKPIVLEEFSKAELLDLEEGEKEEVFEGEKRDMGQEREIAEFYCSIKSSIEEMFICYPEEKRLFELIPNSKWACVEREDNRYVVGVIRGENSKPQYVCYGVPAVEGSSPPENLKKYCQYIPTDEENGYWIVFQDAKTGETLCEE